MSDQKATMEMNSQGAPKKTFENFLKERSMIPVEIEQFLRAVLMYCVDKEVTYDFEPTAIGTQHARSLILSLCQIHRLYGCPKAEEAKDAEMAEAAKAVQGAEAAEAVDDSDTIPFDEDAVKNIVSNLKEKDRTFQYYCQDIDDTFWRDEVPNKTSNLEKLLREPAHIFLDMVRDLFQEAKENDPSTIARLQLESLCDGNYLKPSVWAENVQNLTLPQSFASANLRTDLPVRRSGDEKRGGNLTHPHQPTRDERLGTSQVKNRKKNFAVSVGVRDYIRPLFLYAKLCDLENSRDATGIALGDVKALQSVDRHSEEYKNANKDSASEYNKKKDPCTSCKIFFNTFGKKKETQFNYFGNCAEFDLVQTENGRENLRDIKHRDHWKKFESECKNYIVAFDTLKKRAKSRKVKRSHMKEYFDKTRNTKHKALKYKWIDSDERYELVTKDYNPNKKGKKIKHAQSMSNE